MSSGVRKGAGSEEAHRIPSCVPPLPLHSSVPPLSACTAATAVLLRRLIGSACMHCHPIEDELATTTASARPVTVSPIVGLPHGGEEMGGGMVGGRGAYEEDGEGRECGVRLGKRVQGGGVRCLAAGERV